MANLAEHAQRELERAGMFDADADYGGAIALQVMQMITTFQGQGHSGMSSTLTLAVFDKLARFQPLTPLTSAPDEWEDVSTFSSYPLWQNKRASSVFSEDGGKTWYDVNAPQKVIHTQQEPL